MYARLLRNCQMVFQYLNHATCLPAMNESSGASHPHQQVVWPGWLVCLIVAIQVDLHLCLIVVLTCIFAFSCDYSCWASYVLGGHLYIRKLVYSNLLPILIGLFAFLLLIYEFFILSGYSPLPNICIVNM